jgi:hypothetical protein
MFGPPQAPARLPHENDRGYHNGTVGPSPTDKASKRYMGVEFSLDRGDWRADYLDRTLETRD